MTLTDYIFEKSKYLYKIAVIDKKEYSYKEIFLKVKSIGNMLKDKEINNKNSILLMGENSVFFIESYFGIIDSGAICVPVNPSFTVEHIKYIIDSLHVKIIFVQKKLIKKLECFIRDGIEIFTEEYIDNLPIAKEKSNEVNNEDVAVILFTSGSTSTPKGVMLTHDNLIYNTNSIIEYLLLREEDRMEVVLPFYYCYGTSLLHTHFRVGGSLVINNRFMFPETVLEDINKYKCTGFAGVPTTFQILLKKSSIKDTKLPSLRYITQAGGRMANIFIEELLNILEGVDIFIMYGQTEATSRLSYLPPKVLKEKMGSIGKGIPGTELKVLGRNGQEVAPGEIGEIVAKGGNVMRGYFKDEEETYKVLKNGYLYTGDLGITDDEGYIYIVGREKNIIKSGGNRISPKEIEDAIIELEEVLECAVIGVEDEIMGEAVKVFVVLNDENITNKDIINHCKGKLPSYKLPKYIEVVDKLPKNSSGKVLISVLKESR